MKVQTMKSFSLILLVTLLTTALAQAAPDFSTPEKTLETYLKACQAGDFQAADLCYTESSRKFLQDNAYMTEGREPEQLKKAYQNWSTLKFRTEMVNAKRAVLHPSSADVPPFFLRKQAKGEGWRIDYHFMSNFIKVDENGWSWKMPRAEKIWRSRK